jgi:hypothetical protein
MEFHQPQFHKIQWNSIKFHGKFNEIPLNSMEFHWIPWNPIEFSMEFHEKISWKNPSNVYEKFHGIMKFHGIQWNSVEFHGIFHEKKMFMEISMDFMN